MREGNVDAVHVTISYHETFRETVLNFEKWNFWFEKYPNLIIKGSTAADIDLAKKTNRTAIFFGFQNPSPIEDDIGLIEILHTLGARFMQLTYNNQSLLATGCYEDHDAGITRMGKQVIKEMNRVGMVVDMSHSADQSTIQAAEISERPIAITHANPFSWHPALRNKRDDEILGEPAMGFGKGHHLHLIDGSAFIFRAYHALPPLTRKSDGLPIGAVSGFCNMLNRYVEDNNGPDAPTHVAVIFDHSGHSFRNEIYDGYKANRPPAPEDLVPQFPLTREAGLISSKAKL